MNHGSKPRVGITMGDPAGIGPELCLRVLSDPAVRDVCTPVVFGDTAILTAVGERCGLPFRAPSAASGPQIADRRAIREPCVVECGGPAAAQVRPGEVQEACGRAAFAYIQAAVQAALDGRVAAVVTAPVSKEALQRAGIPYAGHTEMLADLTGAPRHAMMLASEKIVVGLATTHLPYADVPARLTTRGVLDVIELTADALRRLGNPAPRMAVCGLNPHAGEHGLFGREETQVIEPAVRAARREGLDVVGPLPPDTAFLPQRLRQTDAYVAMYHDQGLIPFKMLAFDTGVNVTLGLPFVRTSPDHGTAFDIAWQGRASAGSMIQAVEWALRLTKGDSWP